MKTPSTIAACSLLLLSSCSGFYIANDNYERTDRLAIVSVTLDGLEASGDGSAVPQHIPGITAYLLGQAETILKRKYQLVTTASLADKYAGLNFGQQLAGTYTPVVAGRAMTNFESSRDQVVKARLSAATIDRLVDALDVDAVAVVYTKWGGNLIKTKDTIIDQRKNKDRGLEISISKIVPEVRTSLGVYRRGGKTVYEGTEKVTGSMYLDSASAAINVKQDPDARRAMAKAYVEGLQEMVNHIR